MLRITLENEALLKRIQSKKSHINTKKLLRNDAQHKKYLSNICEYPVTLYTTTGTKEASISKEKINGTKEQSQLLDGNTTRSDKKFRITSNASKKRKNQDKPQRIVSVSLQKNTIRVMGDVILVDATKETRGENNKRVIVTFTSINTDEKLEKVYIFEDCKEFFLLFGRVFIVA